MTNESAGSETSSTKTSATTTTINANIQQPKTVLLQTARAVALKKGKISTPNRFCSIQEVKELMSLKIYDRC